MVQASAQRNTWARWGSLVLEERKPGGGEVASGPGPNMANPSDFRWGALSSRGFTFSGHKLEGTPVSQEYALGAGPWLQTIIQEEKDNNQPESDCFVWGHVGAVGVKDTKRGLQSWGEAWGTHNQRSP